MIKRNMIKVKKQRINIMNKCAVLILSMAFLSGCGKESSIPEVMSVHTRPQMQTSTIFAMDTIMELQIEGDEKLLTEAESKIRNLEALLSVTDEKSDIYALNEYNTCQISETTADIMSKALDMCERTDGALDITIYPVLKAWGFTTGEYRVPTDTELEALVAEVDYSLVQLLESGEPHSGDKALDEEVKNDDQIDRDSVAVLGDDSLFIASIPVGMQVDLGSVAKGYTSGMLADYFKEKGVKSGLINLGGNVECIGTKSNGKPWNVAVKSPFPDSKSGIFGILEASDIAIITSGGYERYFEKDGETYWHIIDPKTGKPAHSGLASVTIVGKDGLTCDALSTALFVKGLEEAEKIWRESDDFDAIFITEDGEVYVTEGIEGSFKLSSEYSSAKLHIIGR